MILYSHTITAQILRGAIELESTAQGVLPHRLPAWARAQCADPQLAMAEAQPSGVRIVFSTRATVIEVEALCTRRFYVGAPARPDGVYDLLVDGQLTAQASLAGGRRMVIDMAAGSSHTEDGAPGLIRFDGLSGEDKKIEIWLPHNEVTEVVALRTDAPITPVAADARKVWLHHGSSISHGSDAASPSATWPALAARRGNVELINLGYGGSALLDPFVARLIRDTPADLISLKIGINLVNMDLMRMRGFAPAVHGFLDTIRDGHPTTPLLLISPILCPIHEDAPGPTVFDQAALGNGKLRFLASGNPAERQAGKLTLSSIREVLQSIAVQRGAADTQLSYVDGLALYGKADAARLPLPDQLHPDAATHRLIGERFADLVFKEGKIQ
jgi:hypothetical protein